MKKSTSRYTSTLYIAGQTTTAQMEAITADLHAAFRPVFESMNTSQTRHQVGQPEAVLEVDYKPLFMQRLNWNRARVADDSLFDECGSITLEVKNIARIAEYRATFDHLLSELQLAHASLLSFERFVTFHRSPAFTATVPSVTAQPQDGVALEGDQVQVACTFTNKDPNVGVEYSIQVDPLDGSGFAEVESGIAYTFPFTSTYTEAAIAGSFDVRWVLNSIDSTSFITSNSAQCDVGFQLGNRNELDFAGHEYVQGLGFVIGDPDPDTGNHRATFIDGTDDSENGSHVSLVEADWIGRTFEGLVNDTTFYVHFAPINDGHTGSVDDVNSSTMGTNMDETFRDELLANFGYPVLFRMQRQ